MSGCAFCGDPMDLEIVAKDPSEELEIPFGEDVPERSIPVCDQCRQVIRSCPTVEEEPWPDWEEINYKQRNHI